MPKAKNYILGIDLGTTNSCAAFVGSDGHPKMILSGKGYTTTPSVVGLNRKGETVVGHTALDQMISNPADTVYGSKRLIGRKFQSLVVQEMCELMPYNIVAGTNSEAAVLLGGKVYDLSEISAMILAEIKQFAEGTLECEIEEAIITVPAYYNDNQRQAVKRAGSLAGLEVRRIVNEPTAAAMAYGLNKQLKQRVLVYDLGGGTFDVSILEIKGNEFKVIATGGDTFLGGIDIDNRLTGFALDKFQKQTGKDLIAEKVAVSRLRLAAEQAKCDLSIQQEVDMLLPYITEVGGKAVDLKLQITRKLLNEISKDLIERSLSMCDEVIETSGIRKDSIDEIILVGGQTRMPLIRQRIEEHFRITPRKGVHPEEVVALGAAILANPQVASSPVELRDVLSIPIGIALHNGKFKVVLDRNTPLPAARSFKITQDRRETLMVDIYQGDRGHILENEYLGTFCFPPPEEGEEGRALEMRFELTQECLLRVRMKDPISGEVNVSEMITLQTPPSLKKSMEEAMQNTKYEKTSGFRAFAQRVLGFGK